MVDLDRLSQLPFSIFSPEKKHNDNEILKIQEWIEKNYRKNLNQEDLENKAGMSQRNFNRRFKTATRETLVKYIQLIRVEAARKILEESSLSFDEITLEVGYENVSFFRRIFKRTTGLSPTIYRKKFGQL